MRGWVGFIARAGVRKVVYVLVGLALAALLATQGVRAATLTATYSSNFVNGAANLVDGNFSTDIQQNNHTFVSEWVQLSWDASGYDLSSLAVYCRGGGAGAGAIAWTTSDGQSGTHASCSPGSNYTITLSGASVAWIKLTGTTNNSNYDGFTELVPTGSPTPTPTPTPTASPTPTPSVTPDPMCDPYCVVALSSADAARLDAVHSDAQLGIGALAAAGTLVVFALFVLVAAVART